MDEIVISPSEAVEFAEFKRQKRIRAVCEKLTRAECDVTGFSGTALSDALRRGEKGGFGFARVMPVQLAEAKGSLPLSCVLDMGEATPRSKSYAVRDAIKHGAAEVEISLSAYACRSGNLSYLKREYRRCKKAANGGVFTPKRVLKIYVPTADEALLRRVLPTLSDCRFFLCNVNQLRLYRSLLPDAVLQAEVSDRSEFEQALLEGADRVSSSKLEEIARSMFEEAEAIG